MEQPSQSLYCTSGPRYIASHGQHLLLALHDVIYALWPFYVNYHMFFFVFYFFQRRARKLKIRSNNLGVDIPLTQKDSEMMSREVRRLSL